VGRNFGVVFGRSVVKYYPHSGLLVRSVGGIWIQKEGAYYEIMSESGFQPAGIILAHFSSDLLAPREFTAGSVVAWEAIIMD